MIFDLDNITVKELYLSENITGYFKLQSMLKPRPAFGRFKAKKLEELPFGEVSRIKRVMLNPTYEGLMDVFHMVFGTKRLNYEMANVVDYFYALNHLKAEIKKLVEREQKMLVSDPDPMMSMAGSEKLAMFGELNTLISLGKQFGKSPEEVEQWSYGTVFSLALHNKTTAEIEKRYFELKRRSYGHK